MTRSLSSRLLVTLLGATALVWLAATAGSAWRLHHQARNMLDVQLAQASQILMALAGQEIVEHMGQADHTVGTVEGANLGLTELGAHLAAYAPEGSLAFHVHGTDHSFHFQSANFPDALLDFGDRDSPPGYSDALVDGEGWRMYKQEAENGLVLTQVAQRSAVIAGLQKELLGTQLLPMALGFPALALIIFLNVRGGVTPLRRIAEAVRRRDPQRLDPIDDSDAPTEVAPLVGAINGLMTRLGERLASEQRFTADAAHELRTPLATLRTHAQVALEAPSGSERRTALARLLSGTERAGRLVSQLLTLARVDPAAQTGLGEIVDLGARVQNAMSEIAPGALARDIDLSLEEHTDRAVRGNGDLVELVARNLVENAVNYTPNGGRVAVTVLDAPGGVLLRVDDSGPGIVPEERDRVFDRFFRGTGVSAPGSGLGLSIVQRIVQLHGARLVLGEAPQGGLRVDVLFGVAPSVVAAAGG